MPVNFEMVLWFYLPILLGAAIIITSVLALLKSQSANSLFLFILLIPCNGLAVYVLISILTGAYPSFIPHIVILISLISLLIRQLGVWFIRRK